MQHATGGCEPVLQQPSVPHLSASPISVRSFCPLGQPLLRLGSRPNVCPCDRSSRVARLLTFLQRGRLGYSKQIALLATILTCRSAHRCAQNVYHIYRETSITHAPAITTTTRQNVRCAGLHSLHVSWRLLLAVFILLTHVHHVHAGHAICFCHER